MKVTDFSSARGTKVFHFVSTWSSYLMNLKILRLVLKLFELRITTGAWYDGAEIILILKL